MESMIRVSILLFYIYTGITAVTITQVTEPVTAGTSFSLVCNASTSTEEILWRNDSPYDTDFTDSTHPAFTRDPLGRLGWQISNGLTDGVPSVTLTFIHMTTHWEGNYSCIAKDNSQVTGMASTTIRVKSVELLEPKGSQVVILCDGVDLADVTVASSVKWQKVVNGTAVETRRCGSPTTTTSTTTSTTTVSPTAAATPDIDATTRSTAPNLPVNDTTDGISRRSAERMQCNGISSIIIENVEAMDEASYICTYSFKESANYTWPTLLLVKVEPAAPSMPMAVTSTHDVIVVSWNISETVTNAADFYRVEYVRYRPDEGTMISEYWDLATKILSEEIRGSLSYEMSGLEQISHYMARVIATNDIGSTTGAENVNLKTASSKPPAPNLFADDIYSYYGVLAWTTTGLAGQFTGFLLKFYMGSSNINQTEWHNKTIPESDKSSMDNYMYNLTGLTADTEYCYTIQSINDNYMSDPQDPCESFTTDIAAPQAPEIKNLTTLYITNATAEVIVYFYPPKCVLMIPPCLTAYVLQHRRVNGSVPFEDVTFTADEATSVEIGTTRAYNLTNLALGYRHEIRLAGQVASAIRSDRFITGNFSKSSITELFKDFIPLSSTTEETPVVRTEAPEADETVTIVVIVSVLAVLAITAVIIIIIVCRKRKDRGNMSIEMEDDLWIDLNTPLLGPASTGYVENGYENKGIDQWAEHCREMHANSDIKFTEEYESILQTTNSETTWIDSLDPANQLKNRYNNIVAYDHSRVLLKTMPGLLHSDYINANYIDSYDRTRAFIATQGPLPNTIEDFWRMVWENNCNVIVMITNVYEKHKKKCEQYWPDSGEAKYGRLTVSFMGVEELAYWTIRRFTIKNTKISKKKHHIEKMIVHYHYTEWPDHGIPEYTFPVLSFVKRACASNPINSGPIVIHCSAGVGRTGTFITLEAMMKQITQKRTVNVQCFLRHIRSLRNHMVQTEDQYIFIHDALLNYIESAGRTDIQPKKFRTIIDELDSNFDSSGETILEKQLKTIKKWSPARHLTNTALLDVNQNKNRSLTFIPLDNSSRVKLPKIAGVNGSDYINASYFHGYFQHKEYVTTQHPSTHTEYDFWRMVWDQNSMTVVMLSNIGEEDCITFFRPKGEVTDWSHKSSFKLTFTQENLDMLDYAIRDFQLESTQDDYEMLTRMFSITCWPEAYADTETYAEGIFQFIEVVNQWHATKRNQTGPIIVMDKYGGKVAAQFCALYTLYNQYHNDTTVDIYSLAYLYHMKRPGVWENQDDYRLLYNSMLQICEPQEDDEKGNDSSGQARGDYGANTFANVRRINTIPRSPEHINRTDTL